MPLLTGGEHRPWSRNQEETGRQIDEGHQGPDFSLFTDSLRLAFLIGQEHVAVFQGLAQSKTTGYVRRK